MTINSKYDNLLKYKPIQSIATKYYRKKLKKRCFILYQNKQWTIVTVA